MDARLDLFSNHQWKWWLRDFLVENSHFSTFMSDSTYSNIKLEKMSFSAKKLFNSQVDRCKKHNFVKNPKNRWNSSYLYSVQKGGFSNLVKIVRVVCTLGRNKTLIKIWLEQNMHKHELTWINRPNSWAQ